MLRQSTSAALLVLSFAGDARQGVIFGAHGGGGVGFPQVRCRLADQYGMIGTVSGRVPTEPGWGSSPEKPFARPLSRVWVDEGSE